MLTITDDLKLGNGTRRTCYRHPEDPSLCVKIPFDTKLSAKQQKREIKYYKKLARRKVSMQHITAYHGTAMSNLGISYIYENARNYDGSPSLSFDAELRRRPEKATELIQAFNNIKQYLLDEHILYYDLSGANIHVQHLDDTHYKLIIVDGVSDVVALPILNIFKSHVESKINRRWKKVLRKTTPKHPEFAHLFTL
ncbi:MAG: YrbL family protein [Akkermansiaceae bacterium]